MAFPQRRARGWMVAVGLVASLSLSWVAARQDQTPHELATPHSAIQTVVATQTMQPTANTVTQPTTTVAATPYTPDQDGDGLSDQEEATVYLSDPTLFDTDGDGLGDADEVLGAGSNPLLPDTDGDGLDDGEEVRGFGTDPLKADTDGDGASDGEEVSNGSDPRDPQG